MDCVGWHNKASNQEDDEKKKSNATCVINITAKMPPKCDCQVLFLFFIGNMVLPTSSNR